MNTVTVAADRLGDRFDAAFHLATAPLRARVAELRSTVSVGRVREALGRLRPRDLGPLLVLSRRQDPRLDVPTIEAIVAEYPYEALVIMRDHLQVAARAIRERMAEEGAALAALRAAASILPDPAAPDEAGDACDEQGLTAGSRPATGGP